MTFLTRKLDPAWATFAEQLRASAPAALAQALGTRQDLVTYIMAPVPAPADLDGLPRGFRCLTAYSLLNILTDRYPSLTRCWSDLSRRFLGPPGEDADAIDRFFVEAWAFCDFPIQEAGRTALMLFRDHLDECGLLQTFQPFIDAMAGSRLGLHQEVGRTSREIRFRELISGHTRRVLRAIDEFGKGEIFLSRIVCFQGKHLLYGDPKCFPADLKAMVEGMVLNKMHIYPRMDPTHPAAGDLTRQYEAFMKAAGPYWMSCVVSDDDDDAPILMPDHLLSYYAPALAPQPAGRT